MLHSGHNEVEGVPVEVVRKRIRRINIRVAADGTVCLSVPKWWATLRQGEEFLREKWRWVQKTRAEVLARPAATRAPVTESELEALRTLLGELNATWAARVHEEGVTWKIRRVKSLWGCCHWRDRYITYNAELARAPRDLVEYVVVHEYTHFAAHNHGPRFYALMDERLPGWQTLRRRLNRREWGETRQDAEFPECDVGSVKQKRGRPMWSAAFPSMSALLGVLVLVGYHELVAVKLHLCVVPMSIVTCLEEGILQLSSTARERDFSQCDLHCRSPLWCC